MGTRGPASTRTQWNEEYIDPGQEIIVIEVSQLKRKMQVRVIEEWGLPESRLTHLVFFTISRPDMPGPDHHLTTLLSIRHSFNHFQYQQGWFDQGTAIRFFREFASQNQNRNVHALVLCSEFMAPLFHEVLQKTGSPQMTEFNKDVEGFKFICELLNCCLSCFSGRMMHAMS